MREIAWSRSSLKQALAMADELIKRRDLVRLTKGMSQFPDIASENIFKAQRNNAQEASAYMNVLVPTDTGTTKSRTFAIAYKKSADGTIGFAMTTSRPNTAARDAGGKGRRRKFGFAPKPTKDERIRAILFANGTDFFYGVWNLNKKRWRGRMRRAMTKSARELTGKLP